MKEQNGNLAPLNSGVLRTPAVSSLTVGQLEAALLALFPADNAEDWDRTGMLCGDPAWQVTGVAVALDATTDAVDMAASIGANVLLTHHPAFLEPPESFLPGSAGACGPGSVVWQAIASNVALMNFHTALDVSPLARTVLPSMLSLNVEDVVDRTGEDPLRGYGQLCSALDADGTLTLSTLAARCTAVFGRIPRVWGGGSALLNSIVTCTGSASSLPSLCLERGYDCLVCGEIRYHAALEASHAGLTIIEIGHDSSELPLCAVLAQAAGSVGVDQDVIRILDQGHNWWTPEATRR